MLAMPTPFFFREMAPPHVSEKEASEILPPGQRSQMSNYVLSCLIFFFFSATLLFPLHHFFLYLVMMLAELSTILCSTSPPFTHPCYEM